MRMVPYLSSIALAMVAFWAACGDDESASGSSLTSGGGASGGAGAGAGGHGAGSEMDAPADAPPTPPKLPFDWVGVIGTGQSLSVGATADSMTTRQPFGNLKLVDNGPDPKYPIAADTGDWATVPLVEPIRTNVPGNGPGYGDGQYPDNIAGETPHSGMANMLSMMWKQRGGEGEYVTAHSVVGWSGHPMSDIDKAGGQRAYPASLHEASVFAALAEAAGKTFGYGGIILTHGESDGGNPDYGAGLFQLWQDYNTDLKAITGQTTDVVLFVSQQSTIGAGNLGNSAVQVWRAGVEHPGQIVCTGPKYQYQYSGDNLHFEAPGYERLGQKYAEVFDAVVNHKLAWKPLQPNEIVRAGAVITIDFDVPNPPLAWDEHISPPHQQVHPEWAMGRGFEVRNPGGQALVIADAQIQGASVVLTLAADPGGAVSVAYALTQDGSDLQGGTDQGMRGQLRDSDELVGYDAETLETDVTSGSAVVTSPGGFIRRAGRDIVTGAGLPADTIVLSHDSDDQLTLSAPWPGASGKVMLDFHHDAHNYCVQFAMDVP